MGTHKMQDLNEPADLKTELFDIIVGFDDEEKIREKQRASRKTLKARRAIEDYYESKELKAMTDDDSWFEDI